MRDIAERAYALYIPRIGRRPAPMDADYEAAVAEGRAHVAEIGGAVAGLLVVVPTGDHLLLENVAVDPDRQGQGIGRVLIVLAEQLARDLGMAEIRLYTNVAMTENLTMYPRLGYVERERITEHGFERVYFAKPVR